MTANDEELIDMAHSTTYRSEIRKYIADADTNTNTAKEILHSMLNNNDIDWED
ncbi:MAG: hypothetical protein IKL83_02955 [Muribaculaceae bacterium]|nr:hypothetical protein [Muribaculaceae bacterium]